MYLPDQATLTDWRERAKTEPSVKPWRPKPRSHDQWPPDYKAVYAWRLKELAFLEANPAMIPMAKAYYKNKPVEFIMDWMDTYNPRKSPQATLPENRGSKWVPFVFFNKQVEIIELFHELRNGGENGLVEKCRDAGVTWLAVGYSVWSWLFIDDDAIGFGSRKESLVDKIGDPDSIFEKIRLIVRRLPKLWLPDGFKPKDHATYMKMINPENGAIISGEAGDNIGRGGRKAMYFKDESAHYERAELVEAALGDNTNVQVDISSVNGLGNVFERKRSAGVEWQPGASIEPGYTRVIVVDWRDHPEKTQAWYDQRKAKYEREGLAHIFAQEVDRDYSAAISNTIIPRAWIEAAVNAHFRIPWKDKNGELCIGFRPDQIPNIHGAGLDVADEGIDRNASALKQWIILRGVDEWGERDPGVTARRAMANFRQIKGIKVQYDCIGIGSNVKSEFNRLIESGDITIDEIMMIPWNAGDAVQEPFAHIVPDDEESLLNKDFFQNMKAQAWWSIRTRFFKTWKTLQSLDAYLKDGTPIEFYDPEELISLDGSIPLIKQLIKELAQPTGGPGASLRMVVNKKPKDTKSPNLADAVVMAYFPAIDDYGNVSVGSYGA